jgi:hypothetical protein
MRIRVVQCRVVLETLAGDLDLNLDELECRLREVQQAVNEAYEAASLVAQAAPLEGQWGTGWSRPRAIFARHNAAVRLGAPKVRPQAGLGERLEREMWQLPPLDRSRDVVGSRPTCSGTVRASGEKCVQTAVYLGSGLFGAHCYSHATPTERERYRVHSDAVAARQATSHEDLLARRRRIGTNIIEEWLQYRSARG